MCLNQIKHILVIECKTYNGNYRYSYHLYETNINNQVCDLTNLFDYKLDLKKDKFCSELEKIYKDFENLSVIGHNCYVNYNKNGVIL